MADATILLVDDEVRVLDSLEALLAMDYRVLRAERPDAALEVLAREEVALVVSDQRMPGMTGTELLGRVAERSPATTCVILTAYGPEAVGQPGLLQSIECVIAKPWDDGMLRTALREFLFEREVEDPRWSERFERKGAKGRAF